MTWYEDYETNGRNWPCHTIHWKEKPIRYSTLNNIEDILSNSGWEKKFGVGYISHGRAIFNVFNFVINTFKYITISKNRFWSFFDTLRVVSVMLNGGFVQFFRSTRNEAVVSKCKWDEQWYKSPFVIWYIQQFKVDTVSYRIFLT